MHLWTSRLRKFKALEAVFAWVLPLILVRLFTVKSIEFRSKSRSAPTVFKCLCSSGTFATFYSCINKGCLCKWAWKQWSPLQDQHLLNAQGHRSSAYFCHLSLFSLLSFVTFLPCFRKSPRTVTVIPVGKQMISECWQLYCKISIRDNLAILFDFARSVCPYLNWMIGWKLSFLICLPSI